MYTLLYRQQHAMIRRQAKALIDGVHGEKGASELRVALSRLAGTIVIHFTTEEESLYPRLQRSGDSAVCATASRFESSLGSLMRSFSSFFETWKPYGAIERDRGRFAAEARHVLEGLTSRLDAEDEQLYVLVDQLPAAS
jgi:hypothetical protein